MQNATLLIFSAIKGSQLTINLIVTLRIAAFNMQDDTLCPQIA